MNASLAAFGNNVDFPQWFNRKTQSASAHNALIRRDHCAESLLTGISIPLWY
jgi:hypothetical protein